MEAHVHRRQPGAGVSLWSDLRERFHALVFRSQEEREMAEKMRFHLEMAGRKAFGDIERYKEDVRDARGTLLIEETIADAAWSLRTLSRRPQFARRTLTALDPRLVVDQPMALDDAIGRGTAQRVFIMRLLSAFAVVALTLAAIGLFGILSYVVTLRRKEIGIRIALGADRGSIRAMVLRHGIAVTALGIAFGLVGALALSRLIASLLFDTSPLDPRVLAGAVLFMLLVAAAAAYFPVRRATTVDPRLALQTN